MWQRLFIVEPIASLVCEAGLAACMGAEPSITNVLTIDLEDWIQSVYDPSFPLTDLFVRNTHRILDLLDSCGVRATFFVLGLAADKAPELVRELAARGHDVQSHGFGHIPVRRQTPSEFAADIVRSKRQLEDHIGREVAAYRAPQFSIVRSTLWALDVLAGHGFACDSSIFPMRMRRYGISGAPLSPHQVVTPAGARLLEVPVAVARLGPVRVPAGGGGYFRLWPYPAIRASIRQLNARGLPATIYVHPYEFAPEELDELPVRVPFKLRLHQGFGRSGMMRKVTSLLREFRFGTLASLLREASRWPVFPPRENNGAVRDEAARPALAR